MTREELNQYLLNKGFNYERYTEYNRDLFTTKYKGSRIEVFVDFYTLRFVWWCQPNKKVCKSFYLKDILPSFPDDFVESTISLLAKTYEIEVA